jgi:hypothetical protein
MLNRMKLVLGIAAFATTCVIPGNAVEQQKQVAFRSQDKSAVRQSDVKELIVLMDNGKDGTISKQDWLKEMGAEFDRLDKQGSGVLEVKEISQPGVRLKRPADLGK